MYHSKTLQHTKNEIEKTMKQQYGNIRILICTSATGMGMNMSTIEHIIHYDPPVTVDDLLHQLGCTRQNGGKSHHLLFCSRQCSAKIKGYVKF